MHIAEGFLPFHWCIVWLVLSLIFIAIGIRQMRQINRDIPESKKLLAISGIFMFLFQFLGFRTVNGCTSSPFGNALGGSIFGPAVASVIAAIVLLLQAFLLGYGGLTTLGANIFSIGVVGPFAAYFIYATFRKHNISPYIAIVFASLFASLCTTLTSALQYILAYGSFFKLMVIFLISQLPFIVVDTLVTTVVFVVIYANFKDSAIFSDEMDEYVKLR